MLAGDRVRISDMAVELKIVLDGTAAGISERRLSISEFGPSLNALLIAVRRIASSALKDAVDDDYGAAGGRYAEEAKRLDIQIESIEEGSLKLGIVLALKLVVGQIPLFDDLPYLTGLTLVEALEGESSGHLRNAAVRNYLGSLPAGVATQVYTLSKNGKVEREARIGEVRLAEAPADLPYLCEMKAQVTGVGFEPGKNEVRLKAPGQISVFSATAEQVEEALKLRHNEIVVQTVIAGKKARLLAIREASTAPVIPGPNDRERLIFSRWDGLLKRLAQ
jgi:hypothetical protein